MLDRRKAQAQHARVFCWVGSGQFGAWLVEESGQLERMPAHPSKVCCFTRPLPPQLLLALQMNSSKHHLCSILLPLPLLQGHFERPPYNAGSMRSAYHVRELEVHRLLRVCQPLDVFLSHDWPQVGGR